MNRMLPILLASLAIYLGSCGGIDCDQLPKTYSSNDEAAKTIKAAHFKIQETVNTSKSSWIRGASYYSCDGNLGFFILKTDNREYLYSEVPVATWNGFKNSNSFGEYYNSYIKHTFTFYLK